MSRFFNTTGPIKKEKHYNIDPLGRIDINEILSLLEQEKYFVLHAPRQTGKTSYLLALMEYLIRTYTNEGDTILDNAAGSGTTGLAAQKLNRKFIMMEKEPDIYKIACERVGQNFKINCA